MTLLLILVLLLLLVGFGFTFKVLWFIAAAVLVVYLVFALVGRGPPR